MFPSPVNDFNIDFAIFDSTQALIANFILMDYFLNPENSKMLDMYLLHIP